MIAIENARLFEELERRNAELQRAIARSEALEQQTATAEVLRVIASSPTDLPVVLQAIAESVRRLCDSAWVTIRQVDGEESVTVALAGNPPGLVSAPDGQLRSGLGWRRDRSASERPRPRRCGKRGPFTRTTRRRPRLSRATRTAGAAVSGRCCHVPLLRDGKAIGLLSCSRSKCGRSHRSEIALLETFADQAVIAIENARLFEELEQRNAELQESNRQVTEALEQQTATADVLRVIAASPADLRAVTNAVAANAARLCETDYVAVQRLEGDAFTVISVYGPSLGPPIIAADATTVSGRAVIERRTIHVHDVSASPILANPVAREFALRSGVRTMLATPIFSKDAPIGAIVVFRLEVRPFTAQQIALLETFADQAVIAIENARLFEELEQRNTELQDSNRQVTEALEQQTATAEILRVIASSPTELEPVLDAVLSSALRLSESVGGHDRCP